MRTFKNLGGTHSHTYPDGRVVEIQKGELVETDIDLAKVFRLKFEEVFARPEPTPAGPPPKPIPTSLPEKAPAKQAAAVPGKAKAADPAQPTARRESKLGKDVSDRFPLAKEVGLVILRKGGKYSVTEEEDLEEALVGPVSKEAVEKYLESQKAEAEAEVKG